MFALIIITNYGEGWWFFALALRFFQIGGQSVPPFKRCAQAYTRFYRGMEHNLQMHKSLHNTRSRLQSWTRLLAATKAIAFPQSVKKNHVLINMTSAPPSIFTTNPRQTFSKHCSASEYVFFFDTARVQLLWLLQPSLWMNYSSPPGIIYNYCVLIYVNFY